MVITSLCRFVEKFEPEWNSQPSTETRVNSQRYDSFRYIFCVSILEKKSQTPNGTGVNSPWEESRTGIILIYLLTRNSTSVVKRALNMNWRNLAREARVCSLVLSNLPLASMTWRIVFQALEYLSLTGNSSLMVNTHSSSASERFSGLTSVYSHVWWFDCTQPLENQQIKLTAIFA